MTAISPPSLIGIGDPELVGKQIKQTIRNVVDRAENLVSPIGCEEAAVQAFDATASICSFGSTAAASQTGSIQQWGNSYRLELGRRQQIQVVVLRVGSGRQLHTQRVECFGRSVTMRAKPHTVRPP
jgi:hypothetical protein